MNLNLIELLTILELITIRNSSGSNNIKLELCADVIVSAAARRSICVGGGAAVSWGRRGRRAAGPKKSAAAAARRGAGGQKQFFLRFTKKCRSILKIFLRTFLVIKALRFADDQC